MDNTYEYEDDVIHYVSEDIRFIFYIINISCFLSIIYNIFVCKNFIRNIFVSTIDVDEGEITTIEEKKEINEKKEIKYEDKYKDKFELLETIELSKERLEGLKNSIIMERTPLGNVIMFYDNNREGFTYYTDNNIPYRFLETVARKYVIMHNCRGIFVDMDEELTNAKNKLEEKRRKRTEEEEENMKMKELNQSIPLKRDVFAKLKVYNKDTGLKVAGVLGEKKYSTSKKPTEKEEENMILKEKANRYSCEGKIINFSFLKKVNRKDVDKKYATSFAEFKRMHLNL